MVVKMDNSTINDAFDTFKSIIKQPEVFLSSNNENSEEIKSKMLSTIYDLNKTLEEKRKSKSLKKLITIGMDDESIWQQLDLQNDENFQLNLKNVSKFLAVNTEKFQLHLNDVEDENEVNSNNESEIEDEEEVSEDENGDENESGSEVNDEQESEKRVERKKAKKTIVDDEFFSLRDMEKFLINEDKREMNQINESSSDGEEIDMFDENDDTNREEAMKYSDFFDQTEETNDENEEKEEDSNEDEQEEENSNKPKSSYELQQERLKKKIAHMENALLDEKPWQMKGEVKGDTRPQNSLLEEILEFDSTTRPAPVITEEVTMKLEDIIRQRIKDKVFDDVVRKVKPSDVQMEYKKQLVLDQEKSKLSLAQVYEKEYIKELEKNNPDGDNEPEEPKEHKEIRAEMKSLFQKLDLLSHFFFTPRPAQPELKIITNLPTIAMEEVAPITASDATLLAPEEVKRKSRGDVIGAGERTESDKNRERRHKKKFQQKKFSKEKLRGQNLVDKVVKSKNVEKMQVGSSLKSSSTAFFNRLQDDIAMKKNGGNTEKSNKRKSEKSNHNAKKLKL